MFVFMAHRPALQNVLSILIKDARLEVRDIAAETLSGFFHCCFFDVQNELIVWFIILILVYYVCYHLLIIR